MASVNNNTVNDGDSHGELHEKTKRNYVFGVRKTSRAKQMAAARVIRKSQAAYKDILHQDFRESLPAPVPTAGASLTAHLDNETTPCRSEYKIGALKRSHESTCEGITVVVMYLKFHLDLGN